MKWVICIKLESTSASVEKAASYRHPKQPIAKSLASNIRLLHPFQYAVYIRVFVIPANEMQQGGRFLIRSHEAQLLSKVTFSYSFIEFFAAKPRLVHTVFV